MKEAEITSTLQGSSSQSPAVARQRRGACDRTEHACPRGAFTAARHGGLSDTAADNVPRTRADIQVAVWEQKLHSTVARCAHATKDGI